jgi:hypothetical protein
MSDAQKIFTQNGKCLYSTSVPNLTYLAPVVQQILPQTRKLKRKPLCRQQVILICKKTTY